MNATSSGVAISAAKIRSPSFSRSSSSTTMTALPAAMSLIARSMPVSGSSPARGAEVSGSLIVAGIGRSGHDEEDSLGTTASDHLLDVLGDHVDLEVDRVADRLGPEHGQLERRRDQAHAERVVVH